MGALASGGPHRRPACGAKHHGGGGLGQPPADAIEASALRARPRWRGRSAPGACGEAPSLESGWGASVHARNLRDCRPHQVASSDQILHFRKLKTSSVPSRAEVRGSRGPARRAFAKFALGGYRANDKQKLTIAQTRVCSPPRPVRQRSSPRRAAAPPAAPPRRASRSRARTGAPPPPGWPKASSHGHARLMQGLRVPWGSQRSYF